MRRNGLVHLQRLIALLPEWPLPSTGCLSEAGYEGWDPIKLVSNVTRGVTGVGRQCAAAFSGAVATESSRDIQLCENNLVFNGNTVGASGPVSTHPTPDN